MLIADCLSKTIKTTETPMDKDTKFALLVIAIPLCGLIYCGSAIAVMVYSEYVREHPLTFGTLFLLIPFATGAFIWLRASAKAYQIKGIGNREQGTGSRE